MGVSYERNPDPSPTARIYDVMYGAGQTPLPHPFWDTLSAGSVSTAAAYLTGYTPSAPQQTERFALQLVQDRADIAISGPEFNFVRFIRVFDVRYARQHESGRDGDCNRLAVVSLGTYGTQGEFSWRRSSPTSLPAAHIGLERWGDHCPSIWHRSVFVEWRDYEGNYGFEQVNY